MAREQKNAMRINTGKVKLSCNIAVKKDNKAGSYSRTGQKNIGIFDEIHPFSSKSYLRRFWLGRFKETELSFRTREQVLGLRHTTSTTSVLPTLE